MNCRKILRLALPFACICAVVPLARLVDAAPSTQAGLGSIPYNGIWSNGSTAGNGFGVWQLNPPTNGGNAFFYIQSSTLNDSGTAAGNGGVDIDTAGVAWGITAINGVNAQATRSFPGALTTSQMFQIDMDNGNINTGGAVGFALQNSSGNSVWEFYFQGGASTYTINAGSVNGPALPSFTRDGLRVTFSLTSASTYSVSVLAYTPGGAAGVGTTSTYTGNLLSPSGGQSITSVRLFNYQAGGGTNNNAYFNSMSISGGAAADSAAAVVYNTTGTTFRVWAPNATDMHVAGIWNSFSTTATPLFSEGNGNWSADVTGALVGQQYRYYISNSNVGSNFFRQDPRARSVVNSGTYNCTIYNAASFNWAGDNFAPPGVSNLVVYELNVGSFNRPGNPAGTFYDATNRLAFLAQLGVNAVEVMPINEFGGDFSWGYNPADIFAVESAYGGPDAFKAFVKAAHQFGIAVLLDVVHNHYGGSGGPQYGDLDHSLWQFDGQSTSGYGGIYFYQDSCRAFAWCCPPWGPRPNYDTPQVYQFIKDDITMWMNEYHVDGFRWDSVGEIEGDYPCTDTLTAGINLISDIAGAVHTQGPGRKINIAEDDPNNQYNSGIFDGTWNYNTFFNLLQPQLTAANDSDRNMSSISTAVNIGNNGSGPSGWGNVVFTENHDQSGCVSPPCGAAQRMPVRIDANNPVSYYARKRSTLGAAITLSTAGIPMLLAGQEMLTTNAFVATTPLDWARTNTYKGIVSFYTDMLRLRRNLDARSAGLTSPSTGTIWQDNSNKIIAYRRGSGDNVVVICNFGNNYWPSYTIGPTGGNLGFPNNGTWYVQLNSDWTKYSPDYSNYGNSGTISVSGSSGTISIAPYSVLILSQHLFGAPPQPQNLSIASVTTNQISLVWDVASAATGYIIKRGGTQIATTSTNAYTDGGLAVGIQYCYTVAATNIGGVSADSTSVCATTLPATGSTGLLAYWTLDEGGGSLAYDSSGNSNTGTVAGAQWTSGMIHGALLFDGVTTKLTVTNSASLNPVNGITIAAWVNDDSGGWYTYPRIVEKGKSSNQYALWVNNSGSLEFRVTGVSNGTIAVVPPSSGVWHHLAASYNGASLISLYIDGQLATQQVASGSMPVTTDPLAIGGQPGGNLLTFFSGTIDDVRLYGSALSPGQIAQLYNTDTVGDGIPNWWRFQYFGTSSSTDATSCASCDVFGTGENNLFKYVAGLNPTDPNSVLEFQIAADTNQAGQVDLMFTPVVDGRTYTVQSTTNLASDAFSDLASIGTITTNGNQVTMTDTNASSASEFYRLRISLP
jgi:1,4-alpha-glucan branching enzyme